MTDNNKEALARALEFCVEAGKAFGELLATMREQHDLPDGPEHRNAVLVFELSQARERIAELRAALNVESKNSDEMAANLDGARAAVATFRRELADSERRCGDWAETAAEHANTIERLRRELAEAERRADRLVNETEEAYRANDVLRAQLVDADEFEALRIEFEDTKRDAVWWRKVADRRAELLKKSKDTARERQAEYEGLCGMLAAAKAAGENPELATQWKQERDEAREELESLRADVARLKCKRDALRSERDAARVQAQDWHEKYTDAVQRLPAKVTELEQQLDEARDASDKTSREALDWQRRFRVVEDKFRNEELLRQRRDEEIERLRQENGHEHLTEAIDKLTRQVRDQQELTERWSRRAGVETIRAAKAEGELLQTVAALNESVCELVQHSSALKCDGEQDHEWCVHTDCPELIRCAQCGTIRPNVCRVYEAEGLPRVTDAPSPAEPEDCEQ